MQQMREQYSWASSSRLAMQCKKTIVSGTRPSRVTTLPPVGPAALVSRSNCRPSITLS